MTTRKPNLSNASQKEQNDTYHRWDLVLDIQKEIKEAVKTGVISLKEFIFILFISICLYIFLSIAGTADKAQMDAMAVIGLLCGLILYGSMPISLGLYIIGRKKLKKIMKQLDEVVINQKTIRRKDD
ncbi:putative membrane protein YesL [Bartonella fuyuanensis]|uniref:Putative membrane protein YesL n=1 Tax=Bartonella fuyuanensis TaxID=1460968 RepID=A0A840E228_9HYPH|nr:hypothetical protein [Bartonella fuyuanensis]MBB4076238.1 putative membrane protein YesL [Bartonella fuyuanensis]